MLFTLLAAALVAASPATASAASQPSIDAPLKLRLDTTLSTPTRKPAALKGGM